MIRLEHVQKIYDDGFQALKNINLEFKEGEINVLIGPSGCGKTTTMKMLNRLIDYTEGQIYINNKEITSIDTIELRRSIGYVIQHIGLFPHMTIYNNVAAVPRLLKWDKERIEKRVDELLDMVGLEPEVYKNRYPSELSGGQQQRIGVIRALAAEPSIILMDEPFSALDPISREQLQDELVRLQKEIKKTIVFVTHDMDEALKIADQIILMKDGEIVQKGTPNEIVQYPANEFVKEFIGTERLGNNTTIPPVEAVMLNDADTLDLDSSLESAAQLMGEKNIHSLTVVDENNKIQGQVTILNASNSLQENKKVHDVLTPINHKVNKSSSLKTVLNIMNDNDVNELPVVDDSEQYVGMITRKEVLRVMTDLYMNDGNEGS
ncbi:betaine/proline/choline family ABC transporter ATP-binding protein [Salirhabdus salicampi]|uniref:betaine/proline/choline family ABC transporter ATP-binding protein n=1 Tax=Salirhabdus salicampi TaxID=476102 RepID=UPI0020C41835|nr:betaine/proline/choline family ABC transporter ATP-binding protein [Salirhabdus salicampi]MCP8618142.1 betaine/proline/choline family ABC transporter ATP-binding protein [Salirhabdus salicampi]